MKGKIIEEEVSLNSRKALWPNYSPPAELFLPMALAVNYFLRAAKLTLISYPES